MEKIIFLDFDGVIRDQYGYMPQNVKRVSDVAILLKAKVVVTSDIRMEYSKETTLTQLERNGFNLDYIHSDWSTIIHEEFSQRLERWQEIELWLANHPEVKQYAILDDRAELFKRADVDMMERIILCNNRFGFVESLVPKIKELLK